MILNKKLRLISFINQQNRTSLSSFKDQNSSVFSKFIYFRLSLIKEKTSNFGEKDKVFWIFLNDVKYDLWSLLSPNSRVCSELIDLATSISFLIAPFCAIANYLVIHSSDIPPEKKPPLWLKILSILGIIFLFISSIVFLMYL